MSDDKIEDPILEELRKITKILLLSNAVNLEKEISKIANTDSRKKMWVLMDGIKMPQELAELSGVKAMAASNFLNTAIVADLIEYIPRKPPRRKLDYVPPQWVDLIESQKPEESTNQKEDQNSAERKEESDKNE